MAQKMDSGGCEADGQTKYAQAWSDLGLQTAVRVVLEVCWVFFGWLIHEITGFWNLWLTMIDPYLDPILAILL